VPSALAVAPHSAAESCTVAPPFAVEVDEAVVMLGLAHGSMERNRNLEVFNSALIAALEERSPNSPGARATDGAAEQI